MSTRAMVWLVVGVVTMVVAFNALFVITELERAVLLRFGKVVRHDVEPGIHVKIPFIDNIRKFDGRVLTLDAPPERFLTLEKKAVIVDSFAKFQVANVETFYTSTSGDIFSASTLLGDRINNGLRNEISKRTLHEVVSGERDELMAILKTQLDSIAQIELGVKVVDVRVKRIDLPPEVNLSVYNRMNTEREIEARDHRARGQELAVGVRADADRQHEVISASAYQQAEQIRGAGDAEAARIYAAAYNKDQEFYQFYRRMNAYVNTFSNKGDVLLIDPDSDFFRYLNRSKPE
jgi:membrane protease subunit HflC